PVIGAFTLTLDPTIDYNLETSGISLDNLNLALGSALLFSYHPTTDFLLVGGAANGLPVVNGTDDFAVTVVNFTSGSPGIGDMIYSQISIAPDGFATTHGSVT